MAKAEALPLKVIGTVGQLQFDVIQYRLLHEYGAECRFEPLHFYKACWLTAKDPDKLEEFCRFKSDRIGTDKDGHTVFFVESEWMLHHFIKQHPDVKFNFTSEFKD